MHVDLLISNDKPDQDSIQRVSFSWLSKDEMSIVIRNIIVEWGRDVKYSEDQRVLSDVQFRIWESTMRLAPFPMIGIITKNNIKIGLVCASNWATASCIYIEHLEVAPTVQHEIERLTLSEKLLRAVIDCSIDCGYHGWIAFSPRNMDVSFYTQLGFSKYDEFTYRRMGYYSNVQIPLV